MRLDESLATEYPGAGDDAALKVHKYYSVGVGAAVVYHLSSAREHDSPYLEVDASWAGRGLLAALGYVSLRLLRDCERHVVRYVIRLKESWKPKVKQVTRGTLTRTLESMSDLDLLLEREVLLPDGKAIDAAVELGSGSFSPVGARLVAGPTPKGYCFYHTSLPNAVGPRRIADVYCVRWEIESDNKLGKSCFNLAEIGVRTGPAVRALAHASMVGSIIIGLLAHHHRRRETRPPKDGTERTTAPIHPQTLARAVGCAARSIAGALALSGAAATRRWEELTANLIHLGRDPN